MALEKQIIQERGPLFAGLTAYVIPLRTVIWGWFDREGITGTPLIALAGILAMVASVQTGRGTRSNIVNRKN